MKVFVPVACLVALLSQAQQGQSFLPKAQRSTFNVASTRLQSSLLIFEEDDHGDSEDDDSNKKNGNGISFQLNGNGQVQGVEIVVGGMENVPETKVLIEQWREKFNTSPAPPLTAVRRARLEREIGLLEQLATASNDVAKDILTELARLWINESGPDAAKALEIADGLFQAGARQPAELVLQKMIMEEGVRFTAPMVQLAALCFHQGRLEESKNLLQMVLEQKPWHIGALTTMLAVCKACDDSYEELSRWDLEQMPSLEDKQSRALWAERMATKAKEKLVQQEQRLQRFFDNRFDQSGSEGSVLLGDEDSWQ